MTRNSSLAALATLLAAATAAGTLGGCSEPRALLILDITKLMGVGPLDSLEIRVGAVVHTWSGDVPAHIGIYLDPSSTGTVMPWVGGCLKGVARASGDTSITIRAGETQRAMVALQAILPSETFTCPAVGDGGGDAGPGPGDGPGVETPAGSDRPDVRGDAGAGADTGRDAAGGADADAGGGVDAGGGGDGSGADTGGGDAGATEAGRDGGQGIVQRAWQGAQTLYDHGKRPQIALGGGQGTMVWLQKELPAGRVVSSRFFRPATGWGSPENLQDAAASTHFNVEMAPHVVMNDDGVALAAWFQDVSGNVGYFQLGVNNRGPGGGWQPSGMIVSGIYALPARPVLALGGGDIGTLVKYDDNNLGGARFDPSLGSSAWGQAYALIASPLLSDEILCANVAVNGRGQAFVAWMSQGSGIAGARVFSGRSGPVDPWEPPDTLDSGGVGTLGCPDIAVDDDGEAVAVWTDNQTGVSRLKTRRYHDAGWDATTALVDTSGKGAFAPSLRLAPDGRGTLLWEQSTQASDPSGTGPHDLWALHYSGAGNWAAGAASLGATAPATAERMAVTTGGETLVVWIQNGAVWANRWAFADPNGWGPAAQLDMGWSTPQGNPDVAIDGTGTGTAIWEQELLEGGDPQICFAQFH